MLEAALKAVNGKVEDKDAFMAALRATNVDTVRGPVKFDEFGNVVGNVYIRKVVRKDGRLVNSVIKTYPDVSQFWTYDPEAVPRQSRLFAGFSACQVSRELTELSRTDFRSDICLIVINISGYMTSGSGY